MSAMDHLFMQIFERKGWIDDLLRQQMESYGQSLASNLLAAGRRPPPWLWPGAAGCPDPKELNREQLISGILFPLPRATTASANCSTSYPMASLKGDKVCQQSSFSPHMISDEVDRNKSLPGNSSQGREQASNMMMELKIVETDAEVEPPSVTQCSGPMQRDLETHTGKKVETTKQEDGNSALHGFTGRTSRSMAETVQNESKKSASHELTGRMTRSMAASLNRDSTEKPKSLSVRNRSGRVTCSKSSAKKLHGIDQLSREANQTDLVKDSIQEVLETQRDTKQDLSLSLDNDALPKSIDTVDWQVRAAQTVGKELVLDEAYVVSNDLKVSNAVTTSQYEIDFLVEPKHHPFDDTEVWCPYEISSGNRTYASTSELALTKSGAEQLQSIKTHSRSRASKEAHDPPENRQPQGDILQPAETKCRMGDAHRFSCGGPKQVSPEVENSKRDSLSTSYGSESSRLSRLPSSVEAISQNAGNAVSSAFTVRGAAPDPVRDSSHQINLQAVSRKGQCSEPTETISRVGSKHIVDGTESCNLSHLGKNSASLFVKECQASFEVALTKSEGATGIVSSEARDPSSSRQLQDGHVSHVEGISYRIEDGERNTSGGLETARLDHFEVKSKCDSHPALFSHKPSVVSSSVPFKLLDDVSEHALNHSSVERDFLSTPYMDSSGHLTMQHGFRRKNSCGSAAEDKAGEQGSGKHPEVFTIVVASAQPDASTSLEPKHLLLERIDESGLDQRSVSALEKENQATYSGIAQTTLEVIHSVEEELISESSKKTWGSYLNEQPQEKEVNRVSDDGLEEGMCESCEKNNSGSISPLTLLEDEAPSLPPTTFLKDNMLADSYPATHDTLKTIEDLSGQFTVLRDASGKCSLGSPVQPKAGEECTQLLTEMSTGSPMKLINTVQTNRSESFMKTKDVLFETETTPATATEIMEGGINGSTATLDAAKTCGMTLAGQFREVLEPREPIVYADAEANGRNSKRDSIARQLPSTALKEDRYFLRSSTTLDNKAGSCKRSGSPKACSGEKSIPSETQIKDAHACVSNVTENGPVQDTKTPNSREIHDPSLEARCFLESLSHNKNAISFKSSGTMNANRLNQPGKTTDHACGVTWSKRRKIEGPSKNILATSPRSKLKPVMHNLVGSDCISKTSSVKFQSFLTQREVRADIPAAALENHLGDLEQSMKCCKIEGNPFCEAKDHIVMTSLPIQPTHEEPLVDLAGEGPMISSENEAGIVSSTAKSSEMHWSSEFGQDIPFSGNTQEDGTPSKSGCYKEFAIERETHDEDFCAQDSAQLSGHDDVAVCDETMSDFRGFSTGIPSTTKDGFNFSISDLSCLTEDHPSVLEQLCDSKSMLTPWSCPSSRYKVHQVPDTFQSLPSGLLEHLNFSNCIQINEVQMKQLSTSVHGTVTDMYCSLQSELDQSVLGRLSSSSTQSNFRYGCLARKPPLTPSAEKLRQKRIAGSSSSEEVGSNPEHVCFRIDENSSTTEGSGLPNEVKATYLEGIRSRELDTSNNRKALADLTSFYQNAPSLVSLSEKSGESSSLDSVTTESYFRIQMGIDSKLGHGYAGNGEYDSKENHSVSVCKSRVAKRAESFNHRPSKAELSGKANERNRSGVISGKGCMPNNIISNVTSFIPLVQSKQKVAAPVTGKRDIKVKALEAAEAARRLHEKKHNEREMRKATAKLERARLAQEHVKQWELKQKQQGEARKKKEADIAARKRQREEGKKEEKRKQQCIEEARKKQREHGQKLHASKEERVFQHKVADEEWRKESTKQQKRQEKGTEIAQCWKTTEEEPSTTKVVAGDAMQGSFSLATADAFKGNNIKIVDGDSCYLQNAILDRMSINKQIQVSDSYEISPYRDSDEEDGNEVGRRKRKHIPLWARRENLDQILLKQQNVDPKEIFSCKNSFDLSKVLLHPNLLRSMS